MNPIKSVPAVFPRDMFIYGIVMLPKMFPNRETIAININSGYILLLLESLEKEREKFGDLVLVWDNICVNNTVKITPKR